MKTLKLIMTVTLLVLAASVSVEAQQDQTPIRVWADGASYAYFQNPESSYVEIYCAAQRKDIQFQEYDSAFQGAVLFEVELTDQSRKTADTVRKWLPISVEFLEDASKPDARAFDVIPLVLRPGTYKGKLTAVDGLSRRSGIATFDLVVKDYSSPNLSLSDLELSYKIVPLKEKPDSLLSGLVKADRVVIPNPTTYFSNEDTLIYFFAEVYNLVQRPGASDEFELKTTLLDSYGYELREFPAERYKKPGPTSVLTKGLPSRGLPGGNYELNVRLEDLATGRKVSSSKKFTLIYAFDQLTPTMSSPDSFTVDDAALMEQVIRYITSKEEKETYSQLNLEGKKQFLVAFWERHNPSPGSKINAYKNERFRRFIYANHYYSNSLLNRTDGWRSDRGRIYITYGQSDQIDRNPSAMGEKPWERWSWDRLPGQSGGNYCLFVDETGYGNYRLVHSTIQGEISNPEYEKLLEEQEK
jgi:GWxTD domain-containing protein